MNNHIEIVQLSRSVYFWALIINGEYIARSRSLDTKEKIVKEAETIASIFNLHIQINER